MTRAWALAIALCPAPALACLPPLPGQVDPPRPSDAEVAAAIFRGSSDIVYARVVRAADERSDWHATVEILHSYKGALKPGARVRLTQGIGFDPPPCFGVIGQMPLNKGDWGVIAFDSARPEWNLVEERWLQPMFAAGLIARAGGKGAQRVGTGSAPE